MLRKSGPGSNPRGGGKKSGKEGDFDKNWDKLGAKKNQAATERGLAISSSKAELNASILKALTAIDEAEQSAASGPSPVSKATGQRAKIVEDPSTAKTEVTATGLGPNEVLNVMWEHLELMANEYNKIVGPGPFHLKLQKETEGKARASISTLTHSMMLIPDIDAVRLYVLPVELNRGEYGQGIQYEPNSIVLMTKRDGRTEWHTKTGVPLSAVVMNSTCRSLFQSLIEQTASYYA